MAATAAEYAWVDEEDPAIFEAYCLTLARGLTAAEFLARLGAQPEAPRTGISALCEPSYDVWADNESPSRTRLPWLNELIKPRWLSCS